MSDPVDLPDLSTLRQRWWTLATAFRSVGADDVWMSGPGRDAYDDRGGSRMDLVAFDDHHAVLTGFDRELSMVGVPQPGALFEGAPAWVPRQPIDARWPLGDVAWFDQGRWHRSTSARGVPRALEVLAVPLIDEGSTAAELETLLSEWGEYEPADVAEQTQIDAAALELARSGASAESLARLLARHPRFDPARAGFPPPAKAAPPLPPPASPPKLAFGDHDRVLRHGIAGEPERPRPAPAGTPELAALADWLRAHAPASDGACEVRFDATDVVSGIGLGDPRPTGDTAELFDELRPLGGAWREAETDAVHGRWLFASVRTSAEDVIVERFYDSLPPWTSTAYFTGLSIAGLKAELDRRGPGWVPSWVALLDPAEAARRVPDVPAS